MESCVDTTMPKVHEFTFANKRIKLFQTSHCNQLFLKIAFPQCIILGSSTSLIRMSLASTLKAVALAMRLITSDILTVACQIYASWWLSVFEFLQGYLNSYSNFPLPNYQRKWVLEKLCRSLQSEDFFSVHVIVSQLQLFLHQRLLSWQHLAVFFSRTLCTTYKVINKYVLRLIIYSTRCLSRNTRTPKPSWRFYLFNHNLKYFQVVTREFKPII